jgi:hypothetical protein
MAPPLRGRPVETGHTPTGFTFSIDPALPHRAAGECERMGLPLLAASFSSRSNGAVEIGKPREDFAMRLEHGAP